MIKHLLLIFMLLTLNSCSNIIPANFWIEYEKDLITDSSSDHGPFGGTTIVSWSSEKKKFNKNSLISFAQNNNWKLVDSITVRNGELNFSEKNYPVELLEQYNNFDNYFKNSTIYLFETGIIFVKSGNSDETQVNGFLILNQAKTNLKAFHKWGE